MVEVCSQVKVKLPLRKTWFLALDLISGLGSGLSASVALVESLALLEDTLRKGLGLASNVSTASCGWLDGVRHRRGHTWINVSTALRG